MTRILVVGGTGVFGSRLAEGLARAGIGPVVLAGRDLERCEAAAAWLRDRHPEATVEIAAIDTRHVTPEHLRRTGAAIVVDAAGPFQGSQPGLARAAIAAAIHYVDLADARDFVAGFGALDADARAAGVVAVTGMSSTPALSNAVLDRLTEGWRRIDRVEAAISPGNRAPRGRSVVAAILSWVGRPVRVFEDGNWRSRPGWSGTESRRMGPLGMRRLALAESPDLDLMVVRHRPNDRAWFAAGLELRPLHDGLAAAAWLVRLGLLPRLVPLAGWLLWIAERMRRFGTDRGGMLVEAAGRDADDRPTLARWVLVAEAGDGPSVPTLPALALIRRLCNEDQLVVPGARNGAGELPLAAIEAEFGRLRIHTEQSVEHPAAAFEAALGPAFQILPAAVRATHRGGPTTRLRGRATVDGPDSPVARLVARAFGFPAAGTDVEVRVVKRLEADGTESWERDFAGHRFRSRLVCMAPGVVTERFGPFTFELAIAAAEGELSIAVAGWRLGPLRLPRRLAPASPASESVDADGRFRFDVPVDLPLIGRLVHYRGWLEAAP